MTRSELVNYLNAFEGDMHVVVESGFGGYWWSDINVPRVIILKRNGREPALALECTFGDDYEELRGSASHE